MIDNDSPELHAKTDGKRTSPMRTTVPTRFESVLSLDHDRCTVTMTGGLEEGSIPAIDALHEQLVGAGFSEVTIDVSGIRHVDELGAGALTRLWAKLCSCGAACRIRGLSPAFADNPIELLLFIRESGRTMQTNELHAVLGEV